MHFSDVFMCCHFVVFRYNEVWVPEVVPAWRQPTEPETERHVSRVTWPRAGSHSAPVPDIRLLYTLISWSTVLREIKGR